MQGSECRAVIVCIMYKVTGSEAGCEGFSSDLRANLKVRARSLSVGAQRGEKATITETVEGRWQRPGTAQGHCGPREVGQKMRRRLCVCHTDRPGSVEVKARSPTSQADAASTRLGL